MNALANETSPYLLQHADNPDRLAPVGTGSTGARLLGNKPVRLSVGYSACHRCHVMAQ